MRMFFIYMMLSILANRAVCEEKYISNKTNDFVTVNYFILNSDENYSQNVTQVLFQVREMKSILINKLYLIWGKEYLMKKYARYSEAVHKNLQLIKLPENKKLRNSHKDTVRSIKEECIEIEQFKKKIEGMSLESIEIFLSNIEPPMWYPSIYQNEIRRITGNVEITTKPDSTFLFINSFLDNKDKHYYKNLLLTIEQLSAATAYIEGLESDQEDIANSFYFYQENIFAAHHNINKIEIPNIVSMKKNHQYIQKYFSLHKVIYGKLYNLLVNDFVKNRNTKSFPKLISSFKRNSTYFRQNTKESRLFISVENKFYEALEEIKNDMNQWLKPFSYQLRKP